MAHDITRLLLNKSATLLDAMRVIDDEARGVSFVVDEAGIVLGSVTDGDIRRAILVGRDINESCLTDVMNRDFVRADPQMSRSEVLDQMKSLDVRQVPVIENGRIIRLHLMTDMLGTSDRPNWAVLMAGGQGTRLRPITDATPKPMVTVAGRPILERLVLHLVGWGIKRIFVSVNHLATVIEDHFGDGSHLGCQIQYLREESPLGSGGSLSLLPEQPDAPVIVANGDLVTQANLGRLLDTHDSADHVATIGAHRYSMRVPFGVIQVSGGRVTAFDEKPTYHHIVNAGIYVLSPELIERVPPGVMYPLTNLLTDALDRQESVAVHLIEEDWADIGMPADLARARGGSGA